MNIKTLFPKQIKKTASFLAIDFMQDALTFKSRVGACLYTKDTCYPSFNIETKIHKGYHAEEVAIINALMYGAKPEEFKGIIITYSFPDDASPKIYPACASCRQFLWEFTNPDLLITVVNAKDTEILYEQKLKDLYPMPYPLTPNKYLENKKNE